MKILLEELPHQLKALEALDDAFYGLDNNTKDPDKDYVYANPIIKGRGQENTNIDIKMETGTGKTYVGVRAMYELHRKYGLFKFIVVVPSPAIKEGWKNFISADYAKQHFSQYYENTNINLNIINAGDFNSKKGLLPAHLVDFIEGDRLNSSTIQVLLINAGMLNSSSMKKEYSQTLLSGWTSPIKGLQNTRPIVLVDEPHRFPRDKANYKAIASLNPQMIIRFGATFPDIKVGKGKQAKIVKDYYRKQPQFNLNAVSSFNDGLVKGIDVYYPNVTETEAKDTYIVQSVTNKELVLKHNNTLYTYGRGEDIGFDGDISYAGGKTLSNGLELEKGMIFLPATMTNLYQELIIRDAIDKHFEAEIPNFMRENDHQAKVKTLSLFFIDSIKSYRDEKGWLKELFEKLLRRKLESLIREYRVKKLPREQEYLSFLQATLSELTENVHAGYFGEDRGTGDAAIQAEVDDILKNKEKLLSFKDDKGNWQTRRFLFSKWTLREGWDNPNVFVIAKLRTSGSDNSKIQEVGRGLRLPVDENGHRLLQDELPSRLRFLIGYDEKDFAQKLVGEVNADVTVELNEAKLTPDMIQLILDNTDEWDELGLLGYLNKATIIDGNRNFLDDGFEKLIEKFPVLIEATQVNKNKITNGGPKSKERIKLNKENWNKMRGLWEQFSNRYMLEFDQISDGAKQLLIDEMVQNHENFVIQYSEFTHNKLHYNDEVKEMRLIEKTSAYAKSIEGMKYGEFLLALAKSTKLTPNQLHKSILPVIRDQYHGDTRYFNELTLNNLIRDFRERFENRYAQSYHYQPLDFQASTSVFNIETNTFKDDILATVIGVNEDADVQKDDRQLYEMPPLRFDSVNPELDLLKRGYDASVVSFGKLPKKAIQVPKYMGGTTTPDFVYVVEKEDESHIYLLVETKAEGSGKRLSDAQIVDIQSKFFGNLKEYGIEYQEASSAQEVFTKLRKLAELDDK
ncbi:MULTISPECIES: type III restriction-modification system endonuclease [Lactobacillales]|uniref:type III restriction-modification system endonuclease n=1 Tax=Lactobacillales TaxID=186826 RepID=UPI00066187FB|nr:type III restriction-modification system endonuclease [Carnobacterium sp. 1290_CSPC]